MTAWSDREVIERSREADNVRGVMQAYIDQAMDYGIPWARDPKRGRQVYDRLFDSSGPWGVSKFAGRLQDDLTPSFQRWFKLEGGPLVPPDQLEAVNRELELATNIVHATLDASSFPKASAEMYAHLALGTGALLATEGDDREPINWQAVPAWGLGIEEGPTGRIENVYWARSYPAWQLSRKWPEAKWPERIQEKITKRSVDKVQILQACYYDEGTRGWRIRVLLQDGSDGMTVWDTTARTNPWIIPRWWTTPGSTWGVGPLMLTLPDIKTANKAVEMILKAAAYSLAPPLMVLHDGVVNPDTLRLAPHALIRVARTGGNLGRSIEPLDLGSRVDLSQIVLNDLRQNISKNLLARELPPATGAVRSPTEIVQRLRELQQDTGPAFGRLNHEYIPGVIARTIDILDRKKVPVIDFNKLNIDQLILRVRVISPLAMQQNLADVESTVRWLELAQQIGGPELSSMIANIEQALVKIAPMMGVQSWAVHTAEERAAMQQAAGAAAAQIAAAQHGVVSPQPKSAAIGQPGQVVGLVPGMAA